MSRTKKLKVLSFYFNAYKEVVSAGATWLVETWDENKVVKIETKHESISIEQAKELLTEHPTTEDR